MACRLVPLGRILPIQNLKFNNYTRWTGNYKFVELMELILSTLVAAISKTESDNSYAI